MQAGTAGSQSIFDGEDVKAAGYNIKSLIQKKEWFAVILVVTIFLVYLNSIKNPFLWDDQALIVENPYLRNFRNIKYIFTTDLFRGGSSAFYRPLQVLLYACIYHVAGLSPGLYHLANILLHAAVALLFFRLLARIYPQDISFLTSFLWGLHPLHTEAVTYISGTADPLSSLFGLGSILLFDAERYGWASCCLVCSLLSRESGVMFLPLIVLWYLVTGLKGPVETSRRKLAVIVFIFLPIVLCYVTLRFTVLKFAEFEGAEPFLVRTFTAFRALLEYIRLLIFPASLSMERHLQFVRDFFHPWVISGFLVFMAFPLLIFLFRKKPQRYFPVAWFFLNYLFVSNIVVKLNGNFREHWMYLAQAGFWLGIVMFIREWNCRSQKVRILTFWFLILLGLGYGARTMVRNLDWQDPIIFFQKAVRVAPDSAKLHFNLATSLNAAGQHEAALASFQQALRLKPNYVLALIGCARAYRAIGQEEKAMKFYQKVLQLKPDHCLVLFDLAEMCLRKGNKQESALLVNRILRTSPSFQPAYRLAGELALSNGNVEQAVKFLQVAVYMYPEDAQAHNLLAIVYQQKGEKKKALSEWEKACRLNPKEVAYQQNLAKMYQLLGRHRQAIQIYRQCLKLLPGNSELMNDLAVSLANNNQVQEAISIWKKILQDNPDFQPARTNLKLAEKTFRGK